MYLLGSIYQCMPVDSEYNRWTAGGARSTLSGAEYQSYTLGIFHNYAHDKNVPCAVCFTRGSALNEAVLADWKKNMKVHVIMIVRSEKCPKS